MQNRIKKIKNGGFALPQALILPLALGTLIAGFFMFNHKKDIKVVEESKSIEVIYPKENTPVSSPLKISGYTNRGWIVFEGVVGTVALYDPNHNKIAETKLKATSDWTEPQVEFEATLTFNVPSAPGGTLEFVSDNPSGLPEKEQVYSRMVAFEPNTYKGTHQEQSEENKTRTINLFYYNQTKDKEINSNILCSSDAVLPVAREIPFTNTPVQDAINLLLKGELSYEEKFVGFKTEFPLKEFSLKGVRSENENLFLRFEDALGVSGGGSCRTMLLWNQISKTALQFPEIKSVSFEPETLFQP
jgi:spore germination protein GerM